MSALALLGFDGSLVARDIQPLGTWIDGWNFNPASNYIRSIGDLDGDGLAEAIVTSDWGLGVIDHAGPAFRCPLGVARNSTLGAFTYEASGRMGHDRVVGIDFYTSPAQRELMLWTSQSMVTLRRGGATLAPASILPNGTHVGEYIVNTGTGNYWGCGHFAAGTNNKAMVVSDPGRLWIVSLQSSSTAASVPVGGSAGGWTWTADSRVSLIADFDGDGMDEILVVNSTALAILKLVGGHLIALAVMTYPPHVEPLPPDSPLIDLKNADFVAGDHFRSGRPAEILAKNYQGLHLLALESGHLVRRALAPAGSSIDGWILNPSTDTLLPCGDLSGHGLSNFIIRSPWGIAVMNVGVDDAFHSLFGQPYGSSIGSWLFESSDLLVGAAKFTSVSANQLLVVKPSAAAGNPPFAPVEFVNWHRNIRRTLGTARPKDLAELVTAVKRISDSGGKLGVAGSGWSFTDCAVGPQTQQLIDTTDLNAVLEGIYPDFRDDRTTTSGNRLIHVEAGIKLYDLNCRLDRLGLALPTMGGSRGQSLAGVLSTGVHGGDVDLPPIADAVRAIHLVGAGGVQHWIEPAASIGSYRVFERIRARGALDPSIQFHFSDAMFNAALVAMGCAGVIYSVVLECRPAFRLNTTTLAQPWLVALAFISQVQIGIPGVPGPYRYLEINVNPADSSCRITYRSETSGPESPEPTSPAGPSVNDIIAAAGLAGPLAVGLLSGAIADYIARTTAEIGALAAIPFVGPALAVQRTAEALRPVQDLSAALAHLGLGAIDPHNSSQVADALPQAVNAIWEIGAFIVNGRTIVDQLQNALIARSRPEGTHTGKSFRIMTDQPSCATDGSQSHSDIERLVESYEYAIPTAQAVDFVNALISLVADLRRGRDAIVVNINLRFTSQTRATLGMQKFPRTCHVEIYTFRGLRGNDAFHSRLKDLVRQFHAVPHWGQLHDIHEAAVFQELGVLAPWKTAIQALSSGNQMFWSDFARERGLLP